MMLQSRFWRLVEIHFRARQHSFSIPGRMASLSLPAATIVFLFIKVLSMRKKPQPPPSMLAQKRGRVSDR